MIGRSSSFLGVAVADQVIACAEVSVAGDRRTVHRTATFTYPENVTLDSGPEAAGQALATFLRQKRFTASRVVVGVPARWLIAVEKDVPPASDDQISSMLRLQAERLAVSEHGEVVFDYAGAVSPAAGARVLLVGMLRQRLDKVERMMDAAGMSILAITSSGLAVAACAAQKSDGDGGLLVLNRSGSEMIWRSAGVPRMLRHVALAMNGHGGPSIPALGAELRRAVATAGQNGDDAASRQMLLLDSMELDSDEIKDLSDRMGMPLRQTNPLEFLRMQRGTEAQIGEAGGIAGMVPAMSLAVAAADTDVLPIDFKHSRLTPPPPQRIGRRTLWAGGVALLVLAILIWLFASVHSREADLESLNGKIGSMKKQVDDAQASVDRLRYGRGYFQIGRPPVLDCMREVTLSFRDEERIWVNSYSLRENGRGTITGKAADQKMVLTVLDRLKTNKKFSDVKLSDMRESDRARAWTYSITFAYETSE